MTDRDLLIMNSLRLPTAVAGTLLATLATFAGPWPSWRGPGQDQVAEGEGYPLKWSATENIR